MHVYPGTISRVLKNLPTIRKDIEQGTHLEKHLKDCEQALVEINHAIDKAQWESDEHLTLRKVKLELHALLYDIKEMI